MVEFDAGQAAIAGLIGGGVMVGLLYGAIAMMPSVMRMNMMALLGGMLGLTGAAGFVVGLMIHAMMSVAFGLAHVGVFVALDADSLSVARGAALGLAHALLAGTMLAALPIMHPLIRAGRMEAPGPFGWSLGPMNAVGFIMLHVLFGAIVALAY
ncbi:MAG: hypothetical protein AMXMBFR23_19050 [Chloroflexota bacterium]